MKIRKHYLTLRRSFPHVHEDHPLEITLEELALHLDCTHRNMVLLLKRMQQEAVAHMAAQERPRQSLDPYFPCAQRRYASGGSKGIGRETGFAFCT